MLGRIDVRNFLQRDQLGFVEEGAQVSLDHKVDALFLLLVHLMQYVVDEKKRLRASIVAPDEQAGRALLSGSARCDISRAERRWRPWRSSKLYLRSASTKICSSGRKRCTGRRTC